jgi:hypothetical protein
MRLTHYPFAPYDYICPDHSPCKNVLINVTVPLVPIFTITFIIDKMNFKAIFHAGFINNIGGLI